MSVAVTGQDQSLCNPLGHWSDIMTDQSNRYVQHHLCCVFINYVVALANRVVSTDFLSGLIPPNKHVISEKKKSADTPSGSVDH